MPDHYPQERRRVTIRWISAGGLLVAAALIVWWRAREPQQSIAAERPLSAEVSHAISGHKLKLENDEYVTYAGIRSVYQNEDAVLYDKALARNAELVNAKEVRLRFDDADRDREGRWLGYVFVGDEFVNETLVREGLAYVRLTPQTRRFAERLVQAQAEAQRRKLGIWKEGIKSAGENYVGDPKYGDFHRQGCEVMSQKPPERLKTFASKTKAFQAGYAPCDKCRP